MNSTSTLERRGAHRLAPPTGSRLDTWWQNLIADPRDRRRVEWILVGAITLVAAIVRFVRLGVPQSLVFDEVYYVTEGWSISNQGYEGQLADPDRDLFAQGQVDLYSTLGKYVVHPPLGKYLIGWAMHLDPSQAWTWRLAVAIAGTLAVPLLYLATRLLFRRIPLAAVAAAFLAIDGHAIVTSRVSILDGLLMFFVLAGFTCFVLDYRDSERRLIRRCAARPPGHEGDRPWRVGPVLWWRPWLVAAALLMGAAASVKWTGVYFLAAFCVLTIVLDAIARRRAGVRRWAVGAIVAQGPVSFLLSVPVAVAVYLSSWIGWLSTDGGYYRHWVEGDPAARAWTGIVQDVPLALQNLWHYHSEMLRFHEGLQADHPYNSQPLEWPFLLRPTAFSYTYFDPSNNPNCHANLCVEAITSLSNPLIYWTGTIGIVFLLLMMFVAPRREYLMVLVGYAAGYLPWLITGRTSVYHFYVIAWLPFMLIAAALVLETIAGTARDDFRVRRRNLRIVGIFLIVVVLVSVLFYPVWTGMLIPDWYWTLTHWLPGWK